MASQIRSTTQSWTAVGTALAALALVFCVASSVRATITLEPDPEDGFGASPNILTVDLFDTNIVTNTANRNVAADRKLRQTFKNPETFNVGQINFGFNANADVEGGMKLKIYEVDDTLASNIMEGDLIKELTFLDTLPDSAQIMRWELTGTDVFVLPARGGEGDPAGYAIEFSTPLSLASDPNLGGMFHSHDEVDYYPDGVYYSEGGGIPNSTRDFGVSFVDTGEVPSIPGDTNGDGLVDIDIDLAAIAAHFRQTVTSTEEGDITGDLFVDFDDFDLWKRNYTGPIPAGALSFLSVPEPGSALLLVIGSLASLVLGRQRRRSVC
jgi:hypothetical protein